MNWNDWEFIWRRQPLPAGDDADLDRLKQSFERSHGQMQRSLWLRDILEASAGLLVAGVFTVMAIKMPGRTWPIFGAVALTLGVTGFFIRERIRTRRRRLGVDASLLAKTESDIEELRHQRRLLSGIWVWYLGPLVIAWALVMATVLANVPRHKVKVEIWHHPMVLGFLIGYIALSAVLFWAVWRLNLRAVSRQIDPRLAELERLRAGLMG